MSNAAEPRRRRSGPSGPSGEHRQEAITLRAGRDGQVDEWREAARRSGMPLSTWIRETLDLAMAAKSRTSTGQRK